MALYSIESEQCLGMAHFGGAVTVNGESAVELSDDEVNILVQLIKEMDTTDVDELDIATSHPALYEKLDDAYRQMAYDAEELHWLWEGYHNGYFEYDTDKLMSYCERELGFKFEYDEKDYYLDDPEDLEEGEDLILMKIGLMKTRTMLSQSGSVIMLTVCQTRRPSPFSITT